MHARQATNTSEIMISDDLMDFFIPLSGSPQIVAVVKRAAQRPDAHQCPTCFKLVV
jgi:hypothetical protein